MSDEKTYTEREVVEAQRAAFSHGATWRYQTFPHVAQVLAPILSYSAEAATCYPLPKVTRPRVVNDPHAENYEWSVRDGLMQFRWTCGGCHEWQRAVSIGRQNTLLDVTSERAALWADLFANPTEEVDA